MALPNLIIAGPPKTGTTSLYAWLAGHPEVCASKVKETSYFSDTISASNQLGNFKTHGLLRYEELFDHHEERIVFEATPEYIFCQTALDQIPLMSSQPLILFIYRNPMDRMVSEYLFHKYKTKRFVGNLDTYLSSKASQKKLDFVKYLKKWIVRTNNIIIVKYDDIARVPDFMMKTLCGKLKIDMGFFENFNFDKKNVTKLIKNDRLHKLALKISKHLPKKASKMLGSIYFNLNTDEVPELSQSDKKTIVQFKKEFDESYDQQFVSDFKNFMLKL